MTPEAFHEPTESIAATGARRASTQRGERWRNRLLAMVLAMLVLYACALAKTLIVPVLLAVLLSLLLAPAVRRLCRWYLPRPLAAFVILAGTLTVVGSGMLMLSSPAQSFLEKAPRGVHRMELAVKQWRRPMQEVSRRAAQSLDRLLADGLRRLACNVRQPPAPAQSGAARPGSERARSGP